MSTIQLDDKSAPQGTKHIQAALVLLVGTAAALLFSQDRVATPLAAKPASEPVLVRRAQSPADSFERATTQLLGYVEAPQQATVAIQTGRTAEIEPRTAARIDTVVPDSNAMPPMRSMPSVVTAAAGPPPRATMRPYASPTEAPGSLTATPANVSRRHKVRDGDTLPALAEQYYGDAARYREIFAANRGLLANPDLLPIGITLEIPGYDPRTVRPAAPPTAARLVPQVLLRGP
jgi:nucleoid-associated protein YgaU